MYVRVKLECRARAKCIYKIQREAIATARHALKLLAIVASGRGEEAASYAHRAGASSAAWPVTLFLSFTLSFLAGHSPVLAASPTAVRALTCHWPCPLASAASVPRLPTRPFIRGSFSLRTSFFSPSFPPLLPLHRRVIHVCIHVRSPSFLRRPLTCVLSSSGSVLVARYTHDRSEEKSDSQISDVF